MGAYRDRYLLEYTLKLKEKFKSNVFIETGTNDGDSMGILSPHFQELYSCEIVPETYELAKNNLRYSTNVTVTNESSITFLETICQKFQGRNDIIFFLDAHWEKYWPLLDELKIIKKYGFECPIIIHDFYIPDGKGNSKFCYDSYEDQNLDLNYVKNDIYNVFNGRYDIYYPDYVTEPSGYAVFTKQSTPFVSFLVTCHNEGEQLRSLLTLLSRYITGNEIVVLDDYSDDEVTLNVLKDYESVNGIKISKHHLNKDYGSHKNFGTSQCSGKYIFQIDADELPNEILLENLRDLIESNLNCEMFWVPRVNNFIGVTPEDIKNYGWRVNEKGYIMWPDYQSRIYKNKPHIKWERKLHETIVGFKEFTRIPAMEELSLYHTKTIEKQRKDNSRYMNEFSLEDNIRK